MTACIHCGSTDPPTLKWFTMFDGRRHIREDCAKCGRWRRWAPQTPEAIAEAEQQGQFDPKQVTLW